MDLKVQIFKNIEELVTLKGAAQKQGRHIQEKDLSIIRNAAFAVHKGVICWVGREKDLSKKNIRDILLKDINQSTPLPKSTGLPLVSIVQSKGPLKISWEEHNLDYQTVIPAFAECHTHTVFAGDRSEEFESRNQGATYQDIAKNGGGIAATVNATREASLSYLAATTQKRAEKFLSQGVTTLEVKTGYGLDWPTELKMIKAAQSIKKLRTSISFLAAHALSPEYKSGDDYVDHIVQDMLPKLQKFEEVHRTDIFVEKGYFNLKQAQRLAKEALGMGLDFTVHADQLSRTGAAAWAARSGACSVDHLVQVSSRDISKIADSSATAVLLPTADFYLNIKYPPARALLNRGARVALATDFNPGSSPTQDLSFVGLLARSEMKMTLPEVIIAYCLGSNYALGYGRVLGAIMAHRWADFVVLEGSWRDLFQSVGLSSAQEVWREGHRIFTA